MFQGTTPSAIPTTEIVLRLLLALACGAIVGLNREFHRKPAGFRTFGLVALGSAVVVLMMLHFSPEDADALSRVIQGVITGIGFLGAGVILRQPQQARVAGLTTAAAVWLTAGLGMAAGAGQIELASLGLLLGMLMLLLGRPLDLLLERLGRPRRGHNPGSDDGAKR